MSVKHNGRVESMQVSADRIRELEQQLAECRSECGEQARLNGAGGEREAALIAQLAEANSTIELVVETCQAAEKVTLECMAQGKVLRAWIRDSLMVAPEDPINYYLSEDTKNSAALDEALAKAKLEGKREALLEAADQMERGSGESPYQLRRMAEEMK